GGKVTMPMAIVGEEAPRHPEFVIPTNPAYRQRALGLFGRLGRELGIPGFQLGGVIGDALSNAVKSLPGIGPVAGAVDRVGPDAILKLLPTPGDLPDWIRGLGRHVIENVT